MLKGVNRRIIEVVDTNSKYFEKALFFVSTNYINEPEDKLKHEAEVAVSFFDGNFEYKKPKMKALRIFLTALVSGLVVTGVVILCLI